MPPNGYNSTNKTSNPPTKTKNHITKSKEVTGGLKSTGLPSVSPNKIKPHKTPKELHQDSKTIIQTLIRKAANI